ncbi:MAG TPA: hypothetical protein VMU26_19840 [Candidatus Polarisedimenticolia bacterium]|nr:hypothetical protein [Candidatus Polarisedimenticolia bacterium]
MTSDLNYSSQAPGEPASVTVRICKNCQHYRLREGARLFGAAELQTPGGLKAYSEWQQQERQHADREAQLVAAGGTFTYEPHHYAWCVAYTQLALVERAKNGDKGSLTELMQLGGATVNPVTGDLSPIYALCIRKNARGDCEKYESK